MGLLNMEILAELINTVFPMPMLRNSHETVRRKSHFGEAIWFPRDAVFSMRGRYYNMLVSLYGNIALGTFEISSGIIGSG